MRCKIRRSGMKCISDEESLCGPSTTSVHRDVQSSVNIMLYDHADLSPLPPNFPKNSNFNGFNFWVPPSSSSELCSLCYGARRAGVNTAFNYKSNSKRATLRCPQGPLHKGLHTQTPRAALLGTFMGGYSPG
ncbi:hypothetical protein EYF80_011038 [Liparis tanakae]|uniref:Uncharacterized protein n=1 Tax=Liparis tanakae TaxID=230148 RepID=A0A4Z2IMB1_9TELE|nr:hypothetical protein EYF80_011038 [Liparis tanakae]